MNISEEDELKLLNFPSKREDLTTAIPLTVIFALLLVTGCIGNICTAIVIAKPKNKYMQTATNYYLFSLAMSDLLFLILGLPQEMYTLWSRYPYAFGESFCIIRGYLSEASTYASILTISAFTIERYIAICHPLWAHTMSQLPRAIKIIIIIWILAAICAIPPAAELGIIMQTGPISNKTLKQSAQCATKRTIYENMFAVSAIVFFIVPMIIVTVLYILIAIELRRSSKMNNNISKQTTSSHPLLHQHNSNNSTTTPTLITTANATTTTVATATQAQIYQPHHHQNQANCCRHTHHNHHHHHNQQNPQQQHRNHHHHYQHHHNLQQAISTGSRRSTAASSKKSVIRMLVAVVVSFFICWVPFHAQRLMASYLVRDENQNQLLLNIYLKLTYISGVMYYLSSTINPLLYQLMSAKFRLAFKETFKCSLFKCAIFKRSSPSGSAGLTSRKLNKLNGFGISPTNSLKECSHQQSHLASCANQSNQFVRSQQKFEPTSIGAECSYCQLNQDCVSSSNNPQATIFIQFTDNSPSLASRRSASYMGRLKVRLNTSLSSLFKLSNSTNGEFASFNGQTGNKNSIACHCSGCCCQTGGQSELQHFQEHQPRPASAINYYRRSKSPISGRASRTGELASSISRENSIKIEPNSIDAACGLNLSSNLEQESALAPNNNSILANEPRKLIGPSPLPADSLSAQAQSILKFAKQFGEQSVESLLPAKSSQNYGNFLDVSTARGDLNSEASKLSEIEEHRKQLAMANLIKGTEESATIDSGSVPKSGSVAATFAVNGDVERVASVSSEGSNSATSSSASPGSTSGAQSGSNSSGEMKINSLSDRQLRIKRLAGADQKRGQLMSESSNESSHSGSGSGGLQRQGQSLRAKQAIRDKRLHSNVGSEIGANEDFNRQTALGDPICRRKSSSSSANQAKSMNQLSSSLSLANEMKLFEKKLSLSSAMEDYGSYTTSYSQLTNNDDLVKGGSDGPILSEEQIHRQLYDNEAIRCVGSNDEALIVMGHNNNDETKIPS